MTSSVAGAPNPQTVNDDGLGETSTNSTARRIYLRRLGNVVFGVAVLALLLTWLVFGVVAGHLP